jgi:hypothetical protein
MIKFSVLWTVNSTPNNIDSQNSDINNRRNPAIKLCFKVLHSKTLRVKIKWRKQNLIKCFELQAFKTCLSSWKLTGLSELTNKSIGEMRTRCEIKTSYENMHWKKLRWAAVRDLKDLVQQDHSVLHRL